MPVYTCARCLVVFEGTIDDAAAQAEALAQWPGVDIIDMDVVCDECWKALDCESNKDAN